MVAATHTHAPHYPNLGLSTLLRLIKAGMVFAALLSVAFISTVAVYMILDWGVIPAVLVGIASALTEGAMYSMAVDYAFQKESSPYYFLFVKNIFPKEKGRESNSKISFFQRGLVISVLIISLLMGLGWGAMTFVHAQMALMQLFQLSDSHHLIFILTTILALVMTINQSLLMYRTFMGTLTKAIKDNEEDFKAIHHMSPWRIPFQIVSILIKSLVSEIINWCKEEKREQEPQWQYIAKRVGMVFVALAFTVVNLLVNITMGRAWYNASFLCLNGFFAVSVSVAQHISTAISWFIMVPCNMIFMVRSSMEGLVNLVKIEWSTLGNEKNIPSASVIGYVLGFTIAFVAFLLHILSQGAIDAEGAADPLFIRIAHWMGGGISASSLACILGIISETSVDFVFSFLPDSARKKAEDHQHGDEGDESLSVEAGEDKHGCDHEHAWLMNKIAHIPPSYLLFFCGLTFGLAIFLSVIYGSLPDVLIVLGVSAFLLLEVSLVQAYKHWCSNRNNADGKSTAAQKETPRSSSSLFALFTPGGVFSFSCCNFGGKDESNSASQHPTGRC